MADLRADERQRKSDRRARMPGPAHAGQRAGLPRHLGLGSDIHGRAPGDVRPRPATEDASPTRSGGAYELPDR